MEKLMGRMKYGTPESGEVVNQPPTINQPQVQVSENSAPKSAESDEKNEGAESQEDQG